MGHLAAGRWDKDHDGKVEKADFVEALKEMHIDTGKKHHKQVDELFDVFKNQYGSIDMNDMCARH